MTIPLSCSAFPHPRIKFHFYRYLFSRITYLFLSQSHVTRDGHAQHFATLSRWLKGSRSPNLWGQGWANIQHQSRLDHCLYLMGFYLQYLYIVIYFPSWRFSLNIIGTAKQKYKSTTVWIVVQCKQGFNISWSRRRSHWRRLPSKKFFISI